MAGRPVAARGGNGMLYGLIAFVIVAVLALGGFIWQLTSNKDLQAAAERAQQRLSKLGQPPAYYEQEATARNSKVFAIISQDIENLALLVTGQRTAVWPAISQAANKLLADVAAQTGVVDPGDTLLTAIKKLSAGYAELADRNKQLAAELAQMRTENDQLKEGLKTVRDEFEQQVAELRDEMQRLEDEKAEQLAAKDEQLAKQQADSDALAQELSNLKKTLQRKERDYDIELTRLNNQIADLRAKIQQLKPGGFDPYDILTKADGRILRAIPGSDVVYINLGSDDNIRPGMTFEVFAPLREEQGKGFRGKASIEVSSTTASTAECRVQRADPLHPIVEGDIIVNIAYERGRKPRFVVRGEFDLDYDGKNDFDGAEKVAAIIRAWGGQIVDDVDETTDFLVIGTGPQVPTLPGQVVMTEVIRSLTDTRLNQLQAFRQDIDKARTLYIPIITQSQFLYLTGYSGRGPVLAE